MPLLASCPRCDVSLAVVDLGGGPLLCPTCGGPLEEIPDAELAPADRAESAPPESKEPAPPGNRLLALPSVVVTPHIAWLTTGTFARSFTLAAENCRRLAAGETLLHRVQ